MKKADLLRIIGELREDEVDFAKTPVVFKWIYEEEPEVELTLIIKGKQETNHMSMH